MRSGSTSSQKRENVEGKTLCDSYKQKKMKFRGDVSHGTKRSSQRDGQGKGTSMPLPKHPKLVARILLVGLVHVLVYELAYTHTHYAFGFPNDDIT